MFDQLAVVQYFSWIDGRQSFPEGGYIPSPAGTSERAANIRRTLTERTDLKLFNLLFVLEKTVDELERMR